MSVDMQRSINALFRRVQLSIGRGALRLVSDGHSMQRVQAEFLAGEVRDGMERFQGYGFASVPLAGMEVIAAFLGGDRSNGVVLAVGDRQFRVKGMQNGEAAVYDDLGQSVHLTREGIVIKGAGLPMLITDTPTLRVEADLEVTGDIIDRVESGGVTMAGMRQRYDGHVHGGVQPGSAETLVPDAGHRMGGWI